MRHLATIQRIISLSPIEGADRIEQARIQGWNLVVGKGEFKVGDFCVFCEIDSILPDKPEFEFMRERKFRVKTIRLKGVVSQGLALPLSVLPEGSIVGEGDDVTELLGVTKYDVPIPACMVGKMKGYFPGFLNKTDEERIQNITYVLEYYSNKGPFLCTEKLDGTSATFYVKDGVFGVCSRNIDLLPPEDGDKVPVYWKVARELDLEKRMKNVGDNLALQGEIIGEGIQKNKYGIKGHKLYVFDFFDISIQQYVPPVQLYTMAKKMNLQEVPFVSAIKTLPKTVDELVNFATIKSSLADIPAEGLVIRPKNLLIDHKLGRLSFKVINPEFLLKYGD